MRRLPVRCGHSLVLRFAAVPSLWPARSPCCGMRSASTNMASVAASTDAPQVATPRFNHGSNSQLRAPPAYPVVAVCSSNGYNLELLHAEASQRSVKVVCTYPADRKHSSAPSAHGLPPRMKRDERFKVVVVADGDENHIGVFPDGSIVGFGLQEADVASIRELVAFCAIPRDPMVTAHGEASVTFRYLTRQMVPQLGFELPACDPDAEESAMASFVDDGPLSAIVVESEDPMHKLPFMVCLAEMVQLKALDALVAPVAAKASTWQAHIKQTGKLPMTMTEARKLRARLLRLSSHLSKISAARHRIFWESECSVQRSTFHATFEHFELSSVNEQLRERLESVGQSLGYVCKEAHADTNHHLELVVILLIVVQVLIALAGVPH